MRSAGLFFTSLLVACSQNSSVESPDASSSVSSRESPTSIVRAHFAGRAGDGGSLVHGSDGYRLASSAFAVMPEHADRPLKLTAKGDAWLEIVADGARSVSSYVEARAVVHPEAFPATDLLHVADARGVEELRVLRSAAAPNIASWTIHRGPAIRALRLAGERIEAVDADGRVVFATEPMFAVDAHETKRAPKLRLEGDRVFAELDTQGLAYPIVLDPTWITTTSTMTYGRQTPFAYTLSSGKVLLLGGVSAAMVDIYDPDADTWQASIASQNQAYGRQWGNTFTVLPTGKILIAGSESASPATGIAELYDPALLKSVTTGTMKTTRLNHTATLLTATNKVAMVGGGQGTGTGVTYSTVELYDIGTGTFAGVNPLPYPRAYHVAALLTTGPNAGKILLAGGLGGPSGGYTNLSSAELLDPSTWTSTAVPTSLSTTREQATITLLTKGANAGKYLIAGGDQVGSAHTGLSTTDLYDPTTNSFSAGPTMLYPHYQHSALTLSDGRVLMVGGGGGGGPSYSTVEVFDQTAGTWTALKNLNAGRAWPATIELSGGRLLVVGANPNTSEVYWPDAVTCSTGATCPTGNCVDGYCCDTACTGQCQACDVTGRKGICSPLNGEAPHGSRTACSPYVLCSAGACATTCASDAACGATAFCDTSKTCLAKKANGSGCSAANECTSGNCVDGYCCNTTCTGTCSACDVAGSAGSCTAVVGTPHGARSCPSPFACNAGGSCATSCTVDTDCATGYFCQGTTCTARLAKGVACTAATQCASANCVDGYCCDSACTGPCSACDVAGKLGTCSNVDSGAPHASRSCAPYKTCSAGACTSTCTTSSDCASGYCSASKCVGGKANGQVCGTGGECTSGFCADGVCCNTACTEDCGSCAVAGLEGTCSPRSAAATCGTSGCAGAKVVAAGHCSGTTLACVPGPATTCAGSLLCDTTTGACKTSCASNADCTTGACDVTSGKCTLPDGGTVPDDSGTPDAGAADTGTTGVDAIAESGAPTVPEHPTVSGFTRCLKGSDCATGFCVDGVCCDSACTDKCSSCALLSNPGKCTVEPIGVDLRSDCGPANTCLGTCDGKGQCIGAGAGTMCGRNRCTSATTGAGPAYCSAPGAKCPTGDAVPFDCAPYLCEPAFGACRTECTASSDCANGFVCDVDSKQCVAAPPPADGGGGCSSTGAHGSSMGASLMGLVLAATLRARRRTTSR